MRKDISLPKLYSDRRLWNNFLYHSIRKESHTTKLNYTDQFYSLSFTELKSCAAFFIPIKTERDSRFSSSVWSSLA